MCKKGTLQHYLAFIALELLNISYFWQCTIELTEFALLLQSSLIKQHPALAVHAPPAETVAQGGVDGWLGTRLTQLVSCTSLGTRLVETPIAHPTNQP